MAVKLTNSQLATRVDGYGKTQTVLRGLLAPDTIMSLQIDWYQRAEQQKGNLKKIVAGLQSGSPFLDIALGMRGERFQCLTDNDDVELLDDTYIIDGFHRVTGSIALLQTDESFAGRFSLGAIVFFNTTVEQERDWFTVWNTTRKGVSPSVIIRNEKDRSNVAATLYGLSVNDPNFALFNFVGWDDHLVNGQIIRGSTLLKLAHALHTHKIGRGGNGSLNLLRRLDQKIDDIGLANVRKNLVKFFDVVDGCWAIRGCESVKRLHMRETFLLMLARLFSDHDIFWRNGERELIVPASTMHDLRRINLEEPDIARLILGSNAGRGIDILYEYIIRKLNKGKTTHRLVERVKAAAGGSDRDRNDYTETEAPDASAGAVA